MRWYAIFDGVVDKYVAQVTGTFDGRIAFVEEGQDVQRYGRLFASYNEAARYLRDGDLFVTARGCYVVPVTLRTKIPVML